MRRRLTIAGMECGSSDERLAPHSCIGKRPGERGANAAGIIADDDFSQRRKGHARRMGIVPAAPDRYQEFCSLSGFHMNAAWYRDLYQIGSAAGATAVVFRVALAVGIP